MEQFRFCDRSIVLNALVGYLCAFENVIQSLLILSVHVINIIKTLLLQKEGFIMDPGIAIDKSATALVSYTVSVILVPLTEMIVFLLSVGANMADIQKKRHKSSIFTGVDHAGHKVKKKIILEQGFNSLYPCGLIGHYGRETVCK